MNTGEICGVVLGYSSSIESASPGDYKVQSTEFFGELGMVLVNVSLVEEIETGREKRVRTRKEGDMGEQRRSYIE